MELLKQYQLIFIVILAIVFITGFVFLAIEYIRDRGLEGIRADVYQLFLKAENMLKESGQGERRMKWVIQKARGLLPPALQFLITDEFLIKIIQLWFDGIKDLLDDGKLNQSTENEGDFNGSD